MVAIKHHILGQEEKIHLGTSLDWFWRSIDSDIIAYRIEGLADGYST